MSINYSFWQGKRVLITGHTGFKGSWLSIWLIRLVAKVTGIALPPNTSPNLFDLANLSQDLQNYVCDIRDVASLKKILIINNSSISAYLTYYYCAVLPPALLDQF
jgi:CDP-glucose 4,6-dehydratase